MSEGEEIPSTSATQLLSAEYKDGQLQIVEVRPFDKGDVMLDTDMNNTLTDLDTEGDEQTKYVQLVSDGDRPIMQLDLLNLTLVRYEDGTEGFRLMTNAATSSDNGASGMVTCVLASQASSDNEEQASTQEPFVVYEDQSEPFMYMQSELPQTSNEPAPLVPKSEPTNKLMSTKMTPAEILERAKQLQVAKALQLSKAWRLRNRGRRNRKSDLPPPHELLASPNFRLFLYSCKLCSFKCNAVKEMTAHKTTHHPAGSRCRGTGRPAQIMLQCAQCPFKGASHMQLMNHVQAMHYKETHKVYLNTSEVEAADVLVCGACGFESSLKEIFRHHIEKEHGATTC